MQNKKWLSYLALLAGVTALSLSAMFVRWADAPGPITGFYRLLFSTIWLFPFFAYHQRNSPPLELRFAWFPLLAGLFTAGDFAIWNTSLSYTSAANATLLGNTAPLWVSLGALFLFRENLRGVFWVGLVLALAGAGLIMGSDFLLHPTFGLGDLMACGAATFYASYQLITQRGRQHVDPFRYVWLVGLSATIAMFFINMALGNPFTGYSTQTWMMFLVSALVSQTIGYFSISYALGHLPASVVSPTLILQPILTTLLAIPLLNEIPGPLQWLGGAIALAGIYIVNLSHEQTA
jgi:drug/metabolite transporter (DMT)-like permease